MKLSSATPSDLASSTSHPDHDRWVKDRTLRMEIEHAKRVGLPLRVAEAENIRLLERADQIAKSSAPEAGGSGPRSIAPDMARRPSRVARNRDRGITIKKAAPEISILKLSPCGRCGVCRNCMRERRVLLVIQKRHDSAYLGALAGRLFIATIHAGARSGKFKGLRKADINRALTAEAEAVCDASIRWLGEWR